MKIIIVLIALVGFVFAAEEVTISGTITETGEVDNGGLDVEEVGELDREMRQQYANDPPGTLQPGFCEYTGKDCPGLTSFTQVTLPGLQELDDECKLHCVENDCHAAKVEDGACFITMEPCGLVVVTDEEADPPTFTRQAPVASANPDTRLFVTLKAFQTLDGGSCPFGAGPPAGVPSHVFSGHFCVQEDVHCDVSNPIAPPKFKATVNECNVECNTYSYCAAAVFAVPKDALNEQRLCYLLPERCSTLTPATADDNYEYTYLARLLQTDFQKRSQVFTWVKDDGEPSCPDPLELYTRGESEFTDFYCWTGAGLCPTPDGNMMHKGGRTFTWEECLGYCSIHHECGQVELKQFHVDSKNKDKFQCNMKDSNFCAIDELVPTSYNHPKTPDTYDTSEYKTHHAIRVRKDSLDTFGNPICPGGTAPDPSSREWDATFCVVMDKKCNYADKLTLSTDDKFKCLEECFLKRDSGDFDCQSAQFQSGTCTLFSGVCEDADLSFSYLLNYYIYKTDEYVCPDLNCPANSSPVDTAICHNTCADPTAASKCPMRGTICMCDQGYLMLGGSCVEWKHCPANICAFKSPRDPEIVADDTDMNHGTVYRFAKWKPEDEGKTCAVGASVRMDYPCPLGCYRMDTMYCPIKEKYLSCHCDEQDFIFDKATATCMYVDDVDAC